MATGHTKQAGQGTPPDHKKIRGEGDAAATVGDNRRAGDTDGNTAVGDPKAPRMTQPKANSRVHPKRTK